MYADSARANFFRPGGDHLTLLNVYNEVNFFKYICTYHKAKKLHSPLDCYVILCMVVYIGGRYFMFIYIMYGSVHTYLRRWYSHISFLFNSLPLLKLWPNLRNHISKIFLTTSLWSLHLV